MQVNASGLLVIAGESNLVPSSRVPIVVDLTLTFVAHETPPLKTYLWYSTQEDE